MVQRLKCLPAMWETWVRSLGGQEDLLEKEMATHSSILAWRIPWTKELGGVQSMGCKESDTTEHSTAQQHSNLGKEVVNQVQEAQSFKQDRNEEEHTETHSNQTAKIKHKDTVLKATRGTQQITYKGTPIRLSTDFSAETR